MRQGGDFFYRLGYLDITPITKMDNFSSPSKFHHEYQPHWKRQPLSKKRIGEPCMGIVAKPAPLRDRTNRLFHAQEETEKTESKTFLSITSATNQAGTTK